MEHVDGIDYVTPPEAMRWPDDTVLVKPYIKDIDRYIKNKEHPLHVVRARTGFVRAGWNVGYHGHTGLIFFPPQSHQMVPQADRGWWWRRRERRRQAAYLSDGGLYTACRTGFCPTPHKCTHNI